MCIRDSHKIEVKAEEGIGHKKKAVLVCGGTGCTSSGSRRVIERLKEEIKKQGLEEDVSVVMTGCFGLCALGPIMIVYPEGAFYSMVKEEEIPEIVEQHLLDVYKRQLLHRSAVTRKLKEVN